MKILNINTINKPYIYTKNKSVQSPLFKSVSANESESTEKENKRKKIVIGVSIAAVVLLLILCRKKIKGLFDRSSGSSGSKKPDEPKKTNESNEKDLENKVNQKILEEYRKITESLGDFPSEGTTKEKDIWRSNDEKRRGLLHILIDNNVSLVKKEKFSSDPNIDFEDKKNYLIWLKQFSVYNKASQLDVIEEYEKYFSRYWIDRSIARCSIEDLNVVYNIKWNDNNYNKMVFDRYLSMMEKFAQKDPDGMRDAEKFAFAIKTNYRDLLDENSALRTIEILKRIAFQQKDAYIVELETNRLNSEKVNNAMKELNEIVKDMPNEHRYQG